VIVSMLLSLCRQGGWVVCEEDKDTLLTAWEEEIVEQRKRAAAVSAGFIIAGLFHWLAFHWKCFDTVGLPSALTFTE